MAKFLDEKGVGNLWAKIKSTFLGKNETADKAKGLVDTGDGRTITARYSNNGNPNPAWYAVWSDATITYASKDEVKNNLGINDLVTTANNALSTANSASTTASNADSKAQQAINQINSVNQDKITKGDLVFSLSGSTLTITKRY